MKKTTKDLEVSDNLTIFAHDYGRSHGENPHACMEINHHISFINRRIGGWQAQ